MTPASVTVGVGLGSSSGATRTLAISKVGQERKRKCKMLQTKYWAPVGGGGAKETADRRTFLNGGSGKSGKDCLLVFVRVL
eukprot:3433502-Prorocentrum_lima.AAC.1